MLMWPLRVPQSRLFPSARTPSPRYCCAPFATFTSPVRKVFPFGSQATKPYQAGVFYLKDRRRVATRYDKLGRNFRAIVTLATLIIWWSIEFAA